MARPRRARVSSGLFLAALMVAALATGSAATKRQRRVSAADPGKAPVWSAGPVNPDLQAKVRRTLIVVHSTGSDPAVAHSLLRNSPIAADKIDGPVAVGDSFRASFVESSAAAQAGSVAAQVVELLLPRNPTATSASVSQEARDAVDALRGSGGVAYVERDQVVSVAQTATQTGPPSWGQDRVDQQALPLNSAYNYDSTNQGANAVVYVVDTGIDTTLAEFGGRASFGADFVNAVPVTTDDYGHGTHVAGTIGSASYGLAKGVKLVGVKVLDSSGSGSTQGIINSLSWVVNNCNGKACIINMSLGGGGSAAFNSAVDSTSAAGVVVAVAAGNSGADACRYSPASASSALTVASTDSRDIFSYFSNFGSCVDVAAPGSYITSIVPGGATAIWSGTSMATPHVAAAAALLRSAGFSAASTIKCIRNGGGITPRPYSRKYSVAQKLLLISSTCAQ